MEKTSNLLIVDDEPGIRNLLSGFLSKFYSVDLAESTPNALQMITEKVPDIILTDVKMPGEDGLCLLHKVHTQFPDIPVILMTGHGDKKTVTNGLRFGAFDYLEKPFDRQAIINTVNRAHESNLAYQGIKDIEATNIHSAKLFLLSEVAEGNSHGINNPLSCIITALGLIKNFIEVENFDKAELLNLVDKAEKSSWRISKIIRAMAKLSKESPGCVIETVSVKSILEDVSLLCNEKLQYHGIQYSVSSIPNDLKIECDASKISQVFKYMLENAEFAIKNMEEKWIKVNIENTEKFVDISITDSGLGIPPGIKEKLFLPFFTTNSEEKSLGLGLYIIKRILEMHKGSIKISDNTENTCFSIRLPKAQN